MTQVPDPFANQGLLAQVLNRLPVPLGVFDQKGNTVFVNQACLEVFNVRGPAELVGKFNALEDPIINRDLGLREFVRRAFRGETVTVLDARVPVTRTVSGPEDRVPDDPMATMYQNITSFTVRDRDGAVEYVVMYFQTNRRYVGPPDIAKAIAYMDSHWAEEFNLNEIVRAVNLSKHHFCRRFKRYTSMTPHHYYMEVKIKRLKEALADKNLTIAQAFSACGLTYSGYHARAFKKRTGMTPSQYRAMIWQE